MHTKSILGLCLLAVFVRVAGAADTDQGGWTGEGALGFVSTSGNTDSENLNASLDIERKVNRWKHAASLDAIRNEVDDEVSADSNVLKLRSEFALGEKSYLFGQFRYEEDEFSGYDSQSALAFGLGSRFVENERHLLDASVGFGYRSLEQSDTGNTEQDGIVTADLHYEFKISDTAIFGETILLESGDENTHSESDTALIMNLKGKLAMKLNYLVKHNSDVPDGSEKTDKITTVSLVYGF